MDILANTDAHSDFIAAATTHMRPESAIIIISSEITYTELLAQSLLPDGVRVNAVAFGFQKPQPEEIAPAYVFLASNADTGYNNGVTLPEIGGLPVH